ncbi:MAG: hypothetical protein ABI678_32685 [Kofleriaceae bacterium]
MPTVPVPIREQWGKVPQATLGFWLIKIVATTLGETGGDAVTMSMHLGYLVGTAIFAALFLVAVTAQIRATAFHPALFWTVIVATTTVGTTLADFVDRSLGIGYVGGSLLLIALLLATLAIWYRTCGSVALSSIGGRREEAFYWATIMFSQTLGTALGDWSADDVGGLGLGYEKGAILFAVCLALVAAAYYLTKLSRTVLFWAAFVLTRPLGATIGDLLDKPREDGGFELSRYLASAVLAGLIILAVALLPQRPEPVRIQPAER